MTLDLSPEQPAEAPADTRPPEQAAVIATVVTIDGVVVRVAERPDGSLALLPSGNRAPLVLDRFQKRALVDAMSEG